MYFPPDRYGAETDNNGTIIGFIINGVMEQDSGATFSCTVGTLSSTAGTLVVRGECVGMLWLVMWCGDVVGVVVVLMGIVDWPAVQMGLLIA